MARTLLWLCAACALSAVSAQYGQEYRYQYPPTQYPIYHHTQPPQPPQPPLPLEVVDRTCCAQPAPVQQPQPDQQVQQPLQVQQGQQVQQEQMVVPKIQPSYDDWTRKVDAIISRGVMQLALSLADAVERDGDLAGQVSNVVFSPVNVASALALVLAGSNGTTFQEIAKVLGIATGVDVLSKRELVHKEFGRYLSQLETQSAISKAGNATGGNQVVFANGLFVQHEFDIRPEFASIAQSYKSEVIPVEFAREPTRTKDRVNSWFSEHTMGRIRSVLSEAPPTDTKLMIASALFFNGAWEAPFPIEATMTRPFYGVGPTGNREAAAVRMMTNNMDLPFVADPGVRCRILELPYKGRDVSMFLVLPDEDGLTALRELERRLDPATLERLLAMRKDAPVIYTVPRMKLQRSISLRTALETLGVRTLFDEKLADLTHLSDSIVQRAPLPAAAAPGTQSTPAPAQPPSPAAQPGNTSASAAKPPKRPNSQGAQGAGENSIGTDNLIFSNRMNLPPTPRLYADDVLHKVEVEVTETGTVASAATAITISRDGSNHVMRFNRPFIFFIRHNATGLVLFYGTVVRPMPEWIVPGVDVSQLPPPRPLGSRPPQRRPPSRNRHQPAPATPATTPKT